jgi:hypothetical protein
MLLFTIPRTKAVRIACADEVLQVWPSSGSHFSDG